MQKLLETLAVELERPRELSAQVIKHLGSHYDINREAMGSFLVAELPKLEDYEIDLILSPLFTPTIQDQAVFAELLGRDAIPADQWPGLIQSLAARPTCAPIVTGDAEPSRVPLREVTIERYVNRLRLDATIPEALFRLLMSFPPEADRPLLKAVARRAVWESEPRRQIFVRILTAKASAGDIRSEDALSLLKLAENYQPADTADLQSRIPQWLQALRHEINLTSSPKPFFNERVEELHGGGRDQRRTDDARLQTREREIAFLNRLRALLAG